MEAIVCYCVEFQQKIGCKVHSYWLRLFEEAMNLVFFLFCCVDSMNLLILLFCCFDWVRVCLFWICFNCADVVMKNMHQKHARTWYKHEFLLVRVRIYAFENYDKPHGVKYACCIRLGKECCSFHPTAFFYRKRRNEQEWDRERKSNIKKNYIEVVGNMHVQK